MLDGFIIFSLLGLVAYQQWLHDRQVRDLTLKIKAPTIQEYMQAKELEEMKPSVDVPEVPLRPLEELDPSRALKILENDLNRGEEDIQE